MKLSNLAVTLFCLVAIGARAEDAYSKQVSIQTVLKTSVDVAGNAISYPAAGQAQISGLIVEIPAGQNTGWHLHPYPCMAYVLSGEIDVEDASGVRRHFSPGNCFVELINVRHCGYNRGAVPVKLIFFAAGVAGGPISRK